MKGAYASQLTSWLAAGRRYFGEVEILRNAPGFMLRHYLDSDNDQLAVYENPADALELGKYDPAGKYRPLRSAPTLKRGWLLQLSTVEQVVRALDYFYPAMLGTALVFEKMGGNPVNLRDTLNRQSGMYRVAGKITDGEADALIGEVCAPANCLKTITWKIASDIPITTLPPAKMDLANDLLQRGSGFIPLPCEECCCMLVAAARETVKKTPTSP